MTKLIEPRHDKTNKVSVRPDQPVVVLLTDVVHVQLRHLLSKRMTVLKFSRGPKFDTFLFLDVYFGIKR